MVSFKFNRSDYKLITVFTLVMMCWLSLKFWIEGNSFGQIIFDIPIITFKTLVALFVIRWLIQRYIIKHPQYLLFFILSMLTLIATGFVDLLRDYIGSGRPLNDLPGWGYIIVHSFYFSAADLSAPFVLIIGKKYLENQVKLAKTKEQQKESEIKLLRSQLSPHFLFNNLNTVDALIDTNPTTAKIYLSKLSSLYRYLISTKDQDVALLKDELMIIEDYFYLIKTRYGDAYHLKPLAINSYSDYYLPTGALQTIVENVVKHNKIIKEQPIEVTLEIQKGMLIVQNTKNTIQVASDSLGTGLKNLNNRYELLLGKTIQITNTDTHFTIALPLVKLAQSA